MMEFLLSMPSILPVIRSWPLVVMDLTSVSGRSSVLPVLSSVITAVSPASCCTTFSAVLAVKTGDGTTCLL